MVTGEAPALTKGGKTGSLPSDTRADCAVQDGCFKILHLEQVCHLLIILISFYLQK